MAAQLKHELKDKIDECVHCGFCLPVCPTYAELGKEMDSPRGRIFLVKSLAEGRIGLTERVQRHLDLCLDCRACETVCPSGVRYGEIIEGTRSIIEPQRGRSRRARGLRWLALEKLLPHRGRLGAALLPLRLYRATGLQALLRSIGFFRLMPKRVRRLERLAPTIKGRSFMSTAPELVPAEGSKRGRMALFVGCIMDHALAPLHEATVRLLAQSGYEVAIPRAQTCCGALHVHNGDRETARKLARQNIAAFEGMKAEKIIVNSAGCGAQLHEYAELLAEDAEFADRARAIAESSVDVSLFLSSIELGEPTKEIRRRAVYDEPCHLIHGQGVSEQPKALLGKIPGLELLPLAEADMCCGSAGVYNLTEPRMSQQLLDRKMNHVAVSGADLLITTNPGCYFQLEAGVRERGLDVEVVHLVELLDRAHGRCARRLFRLEVL